MPVYTRSMARRAKLTTNAVVQLNNEVKSTIITDAQIRTRFKQMDAKLYLSNDDVEFIKQVGEMNKYHLVEKYIPKWSKICSEMLNVNEYFNSRAHGQFSFAAIASFQIAEKIIYVARFIEKQPREEFEQTVRNKIVEITNDINKKMTDFTREFRETTYAELDRITESFDKHLPKVDEPEVNEAKVDEVDEAKTENCLDEYNSLLNKIKSYGMYTNVLSHKEIQKLKMLERKISSDFIEKSLDIWGEFEFAVIDITENELKFCGFITRQSACDESVRLQIEKYKNLTNPYFNGHVFSKNPEEVKFDYIVIE